MDDLRRTVPFGVGFRVCTFVVKDGVTNARDSRGVLSTVMEGASYTRFLELVVESVNGIRAVSTSRLTVTGVIDGGDLDVIVVVWKVEVIVGDCTKYSLVRGNTLVREEGVDHPLRMWEDIGDGRVVVLVTKSRNGTFDGVNAILYRHGM